METTTIHPIDAPAPPAARARRHFEVSVTFEFDTRPPTTHRSTIAASQVATCVRRAIQTAAKTLKPRHWQSVVVVVDSTALDRCPAGTTVRT